MAASNAPNAAQPKLATREVTDLYIRQNFEKLNEYFAAQNQLQGFKFFDLQFTAAADNYLLSHGFPLVPQDVIVTKIVGTGTVTFNHGLFDSQNINMTITGPCRVRFFVGNYWNLITQYGNLKGDAQSVAAALAASSSTTLTSSTTTTAAQVGYLAYNFLVNAGFDHYQSFNSTPAATITGAVDGYAHDQWVMHGIAGGGGTLVVTASNATPAVDGSGNAAKFLITTGDTGTADFYVIQPLQPGAVVGIYNQTCSFSVQVKALGLVTSVGLRFVYATTAIMPTLSLGAETVTTVNTTSFTLCKCENVAMTRIMTTSGTVGVQVRIIGTSSGVKPALNNGFILEQAMLNLGATAASTWTRKYQDPEMELNSCLLFYEKSYDPTTAVGSNTSVGIFAFTAWSPDAGGDNHNFTVFYNYKRTTPTISYWDAAGNASKISTYIAANTRTDNVSTANAANVGLKSCQFNTVTPLNAHGGYLHWRAVSRI